MSHLSRRVTLAILNFSNSILYTPLKACYPTSSLQRSEEGAVRRCRQTILDAIHGACLQCARRFPPHVPETDDIRPRAAQADIIEIDVERPLAGDISQHPAGLTAAGLIRVERRATQLFTHAKKNSIKTTNLQNI